MSNNLAWALVLFTGLQIAVISGVVATGASTILYHLGIAVLIAAVVPAARNLERRWESLSQSDLSGLRLAALFRVDQLKLWGTALFLPLAWIPLGALLSLIG
jgi:hypothetical protein